MKKEDRAVFFKAALDAAGTQDYGRARAIVKDVGVSPASAQAWIKGSLPKNVPLALQVAEFYGFTVEEWVTAQKNKQEDSRYSLSRILKSIRLILDFQQKQNWVLTSSQFEKLASMILHDEAAGVKFIANVALFKNETRDGNNDSSANR